MVIIIRPGNCYRHKGRRGGREGRGEWKQGRGEKERPEVKEDGLVDRKVSYLCHT